MLINNRDIVLQGSGTINGGSGTPLSVPLPSGSSFMPKIDLKYMLEKVNNLVYPYSSTDVPVSYILMVHTHVQNYVSGSKEYEYFDCMDKIFYFMIHNGKYASYNGFKVLTNKVKVYEPNGTEIQIKGQTHNAEYESEFSGNKYTFNMLSTILNSDNGDHKSDAPLNYLNYFPNEINKIKGILGSTGNNMIVDSAFIKSKPKDSQDELPSDGYLSRPNTIVSITLNYPKSYGEDLIICSIGNGFKVAGKMSIYPEIICNTNGLKIAKRIPIYPEISGDMTINKYNLVNLYYYSRINIANYNTITEYPADEIGNIDYTMKTSGGTAEGCFAYCENLTALDVSGFNTSKVTDMNDMFDDCRSLTTLDVSKWDTSNVTDMNDMFRLCNNLTALDVSKWNTSKVTDMSGMFTVCAELTTLDVSKWNTSKVTSMHSMFGSCGKLTTLDVSNFNTSNVTIMIEMFSNCRSLTTLDVSRFDTSKVTNMSWMFYGCNKLATLDVSNFNTSNVTNMSAMFGTCRNITVLDVSKWNTSNVTNMNCMFGYCSNLATLDISKWDISKVTDIGCMFEECNNLATLNVSKWNTSNVTNMGGMFYRCYKLTTLDVSKWDTSKVTSMVTMFYECKSLTTLNVSNFNTSNVTNMTGMFNRCSSLATLNLSNFNTIKVTNMGSMFAGCSNLATLDISNFGTNNVTDMGEMFTNCSKLTTLDLSKWDTSKVARMWSMFDGCESLSNLKINFDMSSIAKTDYVKKMFYNCKITSGSIVFNNVKTSVFTDRATFINAISGSGINSAILTVNFV